MQIAPAALLCAVWLSWTGAAVSFAQGKPAPPTVYILDANASGAIQTIDNIMNMTVVSKDSNDFKAEYRAGFVQGKLQGKTIQAARDNCWDNAYLTSTSHDFPKQLGPTPDELNLAAQTLITNFAAFLQYVGNPSTPELTSHRFKRLLFRMVGIYHGVTRTQPAALDFSGAWLPGLAYFTPAELTLGYETAGLTFLDLYFINAYCDLLDAVSFSPELAPGGIRLGDYPDKCSAFLKRTRTDIILTHNSWIGFLSQTMAQTFAINGDLLTENATYPGLIGSTTDFGYNNKGLMFNETTHRVKHTVPKTAGLWIFWRAGMAEQFAGSVSEFFDIMSLDNSGTYLNGYMLVDANTGETGLIEMSYRCFIYYRSTGGPYSVTSKSLDGDACLTAYDTALVTPDYMMGINYPASYQVASDLMSTDNRPARRVQLGQLLPHVQNEEYSRNVITYTDPRNPLSIFGRWDLGYGETDYPKTIPDGAADAKVGTASMVRSFMKLNGTLDINSSETGFYMLFGTAWVQGKPFIWSQSQWSGQKLRYVPDRLDGKFNLLPLYLK